MADVVGHFGLRGAFDEFLPEQDGVVTGFVPPSPRPALGVLRAPWRVATLARRYDPAKWTQDPTFTAFLKGMREVEAIDPATLPWDELLKLPRRALDLVKPITDLRIRYLPRTALSVARLFLALKLIGKSSLFGDLLSGAHTRTADANRELENLAAKVRADPGLLEPDRLKDFREFQAFLQEYGHRETATPILVTPPTLREDPQTVVGLIQVLAAAPPRHVDVAGPALRSIPRWMLPWVEAARAGIAFREDSHFYFTKPLPVLRRSLLEIGRRLGLPGQDVFHLRLEEIESGMDGERLRALIRARKAKREELAGIRLIDPALVFGQPSGSGALLTGTPASPGTAKGPVKIIREPAEFSKLESGDILVCPYTNPSWTPLFQRAAAVVVDSGGIGSHAAIVAREYGIPAIMGTARGTSVLTDGQTVLVDGNHGRVVAA
jgi:pyruvate,water dikinase